MEIQRKKTRIQGEEFEKWQKESDKIERNRAKKRNRAKNTETKMVKEIAKEKEREKARIWCEEADQLQYHKQQQQEI